LNTIRSNVEKISPGDIQPFPGVEDILKFTNKNVIMTHKERNDVEKILTFYGWENYFVDIVAGDDGYPRKPDPASYQYLHQKHRVDLAVDLTKIVK
jgi:phosphoglycolate phosphatase-like HAD superfamily hydrolase